MKNALWARVKLAAWGVWPDAYVSALAALGAVVVLINRTGAERVTIGKILPSYFGDAYLTVVLVSALTIVWAISGRRAVVASRGAIVLALALGVNGFAIFLAYGDDSVFAMAAYFIAALLMMNRSFVLSRRQLVPWWLAETPARSDFPGRPPASHLL